MFSRPRKPLDVPALYDYAIRALSQRMRTVAELKRLLRRRVAPGEEGEAAVEAVTLKLKEQKYLNDTEYAKAYSAYRQGTEKFGRRRIISDLKVKGVHSAVIENAVSAAYAGVNEEALARQHLARKRMRKPKDQKAAARIFRSLLRAGFASATIFKILKKWDVEDETLETLEALEGETRDPDS